MTKSFQPQSERELRVADFVRDEVAQILQREMRDPRVGFVSVTDARVSKDLAFADIYISSLDATTEEARKEVLDALNKAAGWIRSELAKRHRMRTTPRPRFHYDDLVESAPRLEALIEHAVAEDERRQDSDADSEDERE